MIDRALKKKKKKQNCYAIPLIIMHPAKFLNHFLLIFNCFGLTRLFPHRSCFIYSIKIGALIPYDRSVYMPTNFGVPPAKINIL